MRGVSLPPPITVVKGMALLLLLLLPTLGDCQTGQTTRRADLGRFYPVDLQASANQKRVDNFQNQPDNNLAELAAGKHQLLGIPFEVGDGVLQLGSTIQTGMPEKIGIKVGRKFTTLHVLHSAAYGVNEGQVTIASYTLHYEDGTTHSVPVVNRMDIFAFWKRPGDRNQSSAKEAWVGSNANVKKNGNNIRLYAATWENPRPGTSVVSIDFVSAMTRSAPFCVAMTVADPLQPRAPAKPLTAAELDRLWTQLAGEGTPACDAVEALAGAPTQAVAFLRPRVRAGEPPADVKKIAALITKLDDDEFSDREMASAELQKLGQEALPQLQRTVEESKSAEVRLRAQSLLEKLNTVSLTPDQKRLQAVLYVFELIASDEARKVLDEVANGKAGAWLAAEAEAALKRMRKK
jgi:hypothetical protein